jgi:hypothetical protein
MTKKNNVNISLKKSKKNIKNLHNKKNKLHIIFNLDDTLIRTIDLSEYRDREDYKIQKSDIHFLIKKRISSSLLKINEKEDYLIFLRPYKGLLMNYCLDNFDVSIWSLAKGDYVEKVIKKVYSEDVFNKLKAVIQVSKKNTDSVTYKDIKNKKTFKLPNYDEGYIKSLDYLFNDKFYSKLFNKKNTLIVDTNAYTNSINKLNSIYLPRLCLEEADKDLFTLFMWLYKNKNIKNIQTINKDIFYDKNKILCKTQIKKSKKTKTLNIGDIVEFNKFNKKLVLENINDNDSGIVINKNKNNYDIAISHLDKENPAKDLHKIYKNINISNIRKFNMN